jgi:fimbrial chaperone protein
LQVNPIRVDLTAAAPTAALSVRNDADHPVVVQLSIQAWTQANGEDALAPTRDALVTPPVATIAAHGEQVLRVGLRRAPDAERELAFRLFVQEVPAPPTPGFTGLQVALRIGVPVFVAPANAHPQPLAWSAGVMPNGSLRIDAANAGNIHVRVTEFALRKPGASADAEPLATMTAMSYLLAGQARGWTFAATPGHPWPGGSVQLTAVTDAGPVDLPLAISR